ncbi:hypothetical protein Sjap_018792 [Stephania japonica]|uniref:Uncharacterized protein n=1 Tax=Stephania japonica TaxID=461633 RepID=A0AAP0I8N3_9MAGN
MSFIVIAPHVMRVLRLVSPSIKTMEYDTICISRHARVEHVLRGRNETLRCLVALSKNYMLHLSLLGVFLNLAVVTQHQHIKPIRTY